MVVSGSPKVTPFSRPTDASGLQAELGAIQEIGAILAQLDDPTRARVLTWAMSRFSVQPAPAPAAPVRPFTGPALVADIAWPDRPLARGQVPIVNGEDDTLSVSGQDLFNLEPSEPQPVNAMLKDFVAEFQGLVHDWNAVADEPA